MGASAGLQNNSGAPSFAELRALAAQAARLRLPDVPPGCKRCGNRCLGTFADGCVNCLLCGWTGMLSGGPEPTPRPIPVLTRSEYGRLGAMTGNSHKTKAQIRAHMAKMRAARKLITKGRATAYGKKI